MNLAMQVFQTREAYQIAYTTPATDVRFDNGTTFLFPPQPPTMLTAVVGEVTFYRVADATLGYQVYKRTDGTDYVSLGSVTAGAAGTVATFFSGDITASAYYRAVAFNEVGPSDPSEPLKIAGPEFLLSPDGSINTTHADLNWTESSGAVRYEMTLAYDRDFTDLIVADYDVGNVLTYTVNVGDFGGGWLYYRPMWAKIQAFDAGDVGTRSNTVCRILPATHTITPTTMPDSSAGTPYSQAFTDAYFTVYQTWSIASGSLPAGLTLNASTGVISGTPTTPGSYSFSLSVTDGILTDTIALTNEVHGAPEVPVIALSDEFLHQFTLSWNPTSGGEDEMVLEVATDSGFTSLVTGFESLSLPLSPQTFDVTGLTANTLYYVRLKSRNTVTTVSSAWSNVESITTAPDAVVSQPVDDQSIIGFTNTGTLVRNYLASGFVTGNPGYSLVSLDMRLARFSTETGTIRAYIYQAVGDVPFGTPVATSLNTISVAGLTTTMPYTDSTFNFNPTALSALTGYAVVLHAETLTGVEVRTTAGDFLGFNPVGSTDGITWGSYVYSNGYKFYFIAHAL